MDARDYALAFFQDFADLPDEILIPTTTGFRSPSAIDLELR